MFVIRSLSVLCTRKRQAGAACLRYVCGKYEAERMKKRQRAIQCETQLCLCVKSRTADEGEYEGEGKGQKASSSHGCKVVKGRSSVQICHVQDTRWRAPHGCLCSLMRL